MHARVERAVQHDKALLGAAAEQLAGLGATACRPWVCVTCSNVVEARRRGPARPVPLRNQGRPTPEPTVRTVTLTDVPALAADRLETVRVTLYDYTLEVDELKVDELKGRSVSSDGSVWSPPLPRQHAPGTACTRVGYVTKSGERVGAAVAWPGVLSATPAASTAAVQDAVASGGGFSPSGRRGGAAGQGSASAAPVFVQNGGAAG